MKRTAARRIGSPRRRPTTPSSPRTPANPQREDVAESFLCYLAVRYRPARISKADADKILGTIPNRIAYFDALPLDMDPIAPGLPKLVKASASSELAEPYNEKPQTADRLIEGPNKGKWVWHSSDKDKDPTPWFSLQLQRRCIVESLYIRWKRTHGSVGARPMKYKVLSSPDGKSWTDTKVDQSRVRFLSADMAVDQLLGDQLPGDPLPGWLFPHQTQFIKVEMSESSSGYFSCCYVLVRGYESAWDGDFRRLPQRASARTSPAISVKPSTSSS
jgi:hypothetical protein